MANERLRTALLEQGTTIAELVEAVEADARPGTVDHPGPSALPRAPLRRGQAACQSGGPDVPGETGTSFTHWSIRKLTVYLADNPERIIGIGRERLRQLLRTRKTSFDG